MARIFLRFTMSSRSPVCLLKFTGNIIAFGGGGSSCETAADASCAGAADCCGAADGSGLAGALASCFLPQATRRMREQTHNTGRSRLRRWRLVIRLSGNRVPNSAGNVESFAGFRRQRAAPGRRKLCICRALACLRGSLRISARSTVQPRAHFSPAKEVRTERGERWQTSATK